MTAPPLTIAIPTYNDDPEVFGRVLDLAMAGAPGVPLVIVDMSTKPGIAEVCTGRGERVHYHSFPESGGVSHSRNRCVELATTRHVAFLDSDAYAEPGWLDPLAEALAEDRVAVAGSRILAAWERPPGPLMQTVTASDWLSLLDLGQERLEVPRIIGTSYAIDRERVPDPPFDESIGRKPGWPLAMEENVLCEHARARGNRVLYEPRSVVRHRIPASRATWRWMASRAHAAGRETRVAKRFEPMPARPLSLRDRLFQAAVLAPFALGYLRPPGVRDP